MEPWQQIALTLIGAGAGGFLGVRVAVAVLQTKVAALEKEVQSLRESRHEHAGFINQHESRITSLEKWRDSL